MSDPLGLFSEASKLLLSHPVHALIHMKHRQKKDGMKVKHCKMSRMTGDIGMVSEQEKIKRYIEKFHEKFKEWNYC